MQNFIYAEIGANYGDFAAAAFYKLVSADDNAYSRRIHEIEVGKIENEVARSAAHKARIGLGAHLNGDMMIKFARDLCHKAVQTFGKKINLQEYQLLSGLIFLQVCVNSFDGK